MSYIQFQQKCTNCEAEWNAAFGIVGQKQIAAPPKVCPKCGSEKIESSGLGWPIHREIYGENGEEK